MNAGLTLPALQPTLDLGYTVGAATLAYAFTRNKFTLAVAPDIPATSDLVGAIEKAVPRILISSATTAILQSIFGDGLIVAPIDAFLANPANAIRSEAALGTGTCLDAGKISALLSRISTALGGPANGELGLPGNLKLTATGTGTVNLQLVTTAPIGGALDLTVGAQFDCSLHLTPSGSLGITQTLPGSWGKTTIRFALAGSGLTVTVEPSGSAPIQLLPTFSGLGCCWRRESAAARSFG